MKPVTGGKIIDFREAIQVRVDNIELNTEENQAVDKDYDFDPFHKKTPLSALMGLSLYDKILPTLPLSEVVSALVYQSPEMLKGSYDFKSDVWAIGVTLYFMLCGDLPFYGNDKKSIKFCIQNGHVFFRCKFSYL